MSLQNPAAAFLQSIFSFFLPQEEYGAYCTSPSHLAGKSMAARDTRLASVPQFGAAPPPQIIPS